MNGKKARKIRKLLNLKLPVVADLRVGSEKEKYNYVENPQTGKVEMVKIKRISILNAAKHQYHQVKKQLRHVKLPKIVNSPISQKEA